MAHKNQMRRLDRFRENQRQQQRKQQRERQRKQLARTMWREPMQLVDSVAKQRFQPTLPPFFPLFPPLMDHE